MVKVKISDGILEGEKVNNQYGGTYYSFKGIPYAKPPLGDLRFQVNKLCMIYVYICLCMYVLHILRLVILCTHLYLQQEIYFS